MGTNTPPLRSCFSNPGNVLPFEQKIVDRSLWAEKKEQVEQLKPKNQPWAEITDFIDYSRGIINIAECLLLQNPHCCLAPLRGASFPGSLTKVTTYGKVAFDYFDYRNRNLSGRRAEIIKEMGNIIARRNTGEESFRLAVIDAAIGGHGINDLVPFHKRGLATNAQIFLPGMGAGHPFVARQARRN